MPPRWPFGIFGARPALRPSYPHLRSGTSRDGRVDAIFAWSSQLALTPLLQTASDRDERFFVWVSRGSVLTVAVRHRWVEGDWQDQEEQRRRFGSCLGLASDAWVRHPSEPDGRRQAHDTSAIERMRYLRPLLGIATGGRMALRIDWFRPRDRRAECWPSPFPSDTQAHVSSRTLGPRWRLGAASWVGDKKQ